MLAKPKYSTRLTRPITPGIIQLAQVGSYDEWLKSDQPRHEFISRMYDLMKHYKIDPSDRDCWFTLACDLASDHIKGFTVAPIHKGPGRPRKVRPRPQQPKKGRGRPEANTLEDAKELVRIVDGQNQKFEEMRGKRVTYKETLEHLITRYAKTINKSATVLVSTELTYYQRKLSEARRKIRENP